MRRGESANEERPARHRDDAALSCDPANTPMPKLNSQDRMRAPKGLLIGIAGGLVLWGTLFAWMILR